MKESVEVQTFNIIIKKKTHKSSQMYHVYRFPNLSSYLVITVANNRGHK